MISTYGLYDEDELDEVREPTYSFNIYEEDGIVYAEMLVSDGENEAEIGRAYGRILEDGAKGKAQAASWAMKKLYEGIE